MPSKKSWCTSSNLKNKMSRRFSRDDGQSRVIKQTQTGFWGVSLRWLRSRFTITLFICLVGEIVFFPDLFFASFALLKGLEAEKYKGKGNIHGIPRYYLCEIASKSRCAKKAKHDIFYETFFSAIDSFESGLPRNPNDISKPLAAMASRPAQ